jgi:uncharacterized membrane protein
MSSIRRYLAILIAIFTMALMAWAVIEIIGHGITLWTSAVLIYLALVSSTLWLSRNDRAKNLSPSFSVIPNNPGGQKLPSDGQPEVSEKTPQEIILETIRTKGKAQRHDLLPQVGLSRSSLGRILDQMEAKGLIRQEGDRKASHYVLAEKQG